MMLLLSLPFLLLSTLMYLFRVEVFTSMCKEVLCPFHVLSILWYHSSKVRLYSSQKLLCSVCSARIALMDEQKFEKSKAECPVEVSPKTKECLVGSDLVDDGLGNSTSSGTGVTLVRSQLAWFWMVVRSGCKSGSGKWSLKARQYLLPPLTIIFNAKHASRLILGLLLTITSPLS